MPDKEKRAKSKRKAYYRRCAAGVKRAKQRELEAGLMPISSTRFRRLEPGMTGVLLSSNNREERQALIEAFRLLNDAHDRLNDGLAHPSAAEGCVVDKKKMEDDDNVDIAAAIREEIQAYETEKHYNFRHVKSGVSNCVFILNQSEESSTADIVYEVLRYVADSGTSKSRHILRFQPVMATCRPTTGDLRILVGKAWKAYWNGMDTFEDGKPLCLLCPEVPHQRVRFIQQEKADEPSEKKRYFTVNFRARNYDKLSKSEALMTVLAAMQEVAPEWSPIPTGADLVISIDVLRNVLCLSFLEKYADFAKYNIHELAFDKQ